MNMRKHSFFLLLIPFLALTVQVQTAMAQEPEPSDDEVNAIAKQLYCPVCENIPLDVCPTVACEQWRGTIREKLSEGWDESQIKTYFVAQYGDRVLATPPATGLNVLVYILPPAAFLLGAVVLFRAFRGWTNPSTPMDTESAPAKQAEHDPYISRFEDLVRESET